jgi:hypothetical protein
MTINDPNKAKNNEIKKETNTPRQLVNPNTPRQPVNPMTINDPNKAKNNEIKKENNTPRQLLNPNTPRQAVNPKTPMQPAKSRSVDTKDTGRSNVMNKEPKDTKKISINQANPNKRDLLMDQALKKAKLEHERRFNEKNNTNKNNNASNAKGRDMNKEASNKEKWAHEKNEQFIKREVNRVIVIQNSQQFNQGNYLLYVLLKN